MAKIKAISGLNTVIRNMTKTKKVLGRDICRGLIKAGVFLHRESEKLVPKQVGTLHSDSETRNVGGRGFDTDVIVAYGMAGAAGYAAYVHEDLNKLHGRAFNIHYASEIAAAKGTKRGTAAGGMFNRGENQQAKFLEKPAREKKKQIIKIIHREARL